MKKERFRVYSLSADILILALSYVLMTMLKPEGMRSYIPSHLPFFVILVLIWVTVSYLSGKIGKGHIINLRTLLSHVLSSNLIATSIVALLLFAIRDLGYSRTVVFGTAITATVLELLFGIIWFSYHKAHIVVTEEEKPTERDLVARAQAVNGNGTRPDPHLTLRLQEGCSRERAETLASMVNRDESSKLAVVSTSEAFNIQNLAPGDYTCIINLKPVNRFAEIDKFLDVVNARLAGDGIFLCCVETMEQRAARLKHELTPLIYYIIYLPDFILRRVIPRLRITSWLWQLVSSGSNPPLSRAETLGRLGRAGFEIRLEKFARDMLCIKAQRVSAPKPANGSGYGVIIGLPRVGQGGETFTVYKLRTMHPYSEFIQDYVYGIHDLEAGGKMKHDFRVTEWGRFFRKIFIDELPMLANILRGDLKIVGVRPLSKHYFNLYDDAIRDRRIKYKPGLLPPYYADMPVGLEEIQKSEQKYLDQWDKNPLATDFKYFWKSVYNIIFRNARSN